jgi:hypothetical protein
MIRYKIVLLLILCFSISNISATNINGYAPQYEFIYTLPSKYSGCNNGITGNGVKVIKLNTDWLDINNSDYSLFCVMPNDYSNVGNVIIRSSGKPSGYKYIVLYNGSSIVNTHPAKLVSEKKAIVRMLTFDSAGYWVINNLTIEDAPWGSNIRLINSSNDIILNKLLVQNTAQNGGNGIQIKGSRTSNIVIQNSVIRKSSITPGYDSVGINIEAPGTEGIRIINNEIYNFASHAIQLDSGVNGNSTPGAIIENNDLYISPDLYTDGNGNFTVNGSYAAAEELMWFKNGGTISKPIILLNNRMWGTRRTDKNTCCAGGSRGSLTGAGHNQLREIKYIKWINNIMFNAGGGLNTSHQGVSHLSFIGNIFYDINYAVCDSVKVGGNKTGDQCIDKKEANPAILSGVGDNIEFYLNAVVNSKFALQDNSSMTNMDVRCNYYVNTGGTWNWGAGWDTIASNTTDNNAFFNSIPFNFNGESDIVYKNMSDSKTQEFCFYKKLLTGAEKTCIPNVRPTTSSPHYKKCKSTLGSRQNIGVDDAELLQ